MRVILYVRGDAAGKLLRPRRRSVKEVSLMTLLRCICLVFLGALLLPAAGQAEFEFSPQDWKAGLGLANPEGDLGWGCTLPAG